MGQDEVEAGRIAGAKLKEMGGKVGICVNQEVGNVSLDLRCKGFTEGFGGKVTVLPVSNDPADIRAKVKAWINESFGRLAKPKRTLPRLYTLDPAQDGERAVTIRCVGGTAQVMLGYHVPAGAHPDYPAMELYAQIVGDSPTGRAHKRLVEAGLAAAVYGESLATADPGAALFGAQFAAGQDSARGAQELIQVIEGVANEPITEEEFKRAQTKWLKNWDQQYSNPETIGLVLSETVAQGDWRLLFLTRDRVQALTRDDVQRAAQARFVASNRTLSSYVPTEKPVRAPAYQALDVAAQLKDFKPKASAAAVAPFDSSPANIDAKTQRFSLANGMKLALLPKPTRGQTVRVAITDAAGAPVDDATIQIDSGMPQHGHGLPTRPRVTRALGNGLYEIEGVRFNMGGWWEFKLAINTPSGSDIVTFNLAL